MIILDTNVVSELMRLAPSPTVQMWVASRHSEALYLSANGEAELRTGVALLPDGRRKRAFEAEIDGLISEDFAERVLPFDSAAARAYALIVAVRRVSGRPMAMADAQIAAIAFVHQATVATRNTRDFEGCGIDVVDPWDAG